MSGHLPAALALDTPSTCLTAELESLKLEKPFQKVRTWATPHERFLPQRGRGLVSIGTCSSHVPRLSGGVADPTTFHPACLPTEYTTPVSTVPSRGAILPAKISNQPQLFC